jgi:hypothetical protein
MENCPNSVSSRQSLSEWAYKRNLWDGFYLRLFVVALVFNIFMYFIMKRRKNMVLIFYILVMTIYNLCMLGFGFQLFWPNSPAFQNHVLPCFSCVSVILLVQFCIWFSDIERLNPISYRIFYVARLVWRFNLERNPLFWIKPARI